VLPEEARDYDNSIKDLRPSCKGRPSTKRDSRVVCLFRSQCDSLPTLLFFERLHPTTRTRTTRTLDDDVDNAVTLMHIQCYAHARNF